MGRDFSNRRKKRRRERRWWDEPGRVMRVYHCSEFSYLIHFPRWMAPFVVTLAPRSWGLLHPGHFYSLFPDTPRPPMKKPVKQATPGGSYAAPIDDILDRFPLLAEQLTATAYDGDPPGTRQTATLLLFGQDGSWKACLRDRQEQRTLWVAVHSLLNAFEALENALGDPEAVWREDRMSGAPEAKRQNPKK